MNTLRRVGLVVVSCIILLLALLCPVSAASFTFDDDLLIDDDLMLMPNGTLSNGNIATTDLASSPNYPNFTPNMIPWKDAPDYVKSVLIANLNDFNQPNFPYSTTRQLVPFVCVRVNGSNAMVYVGWNISIVFLGDSNRPVIGRFSWIESQSIQDIQYSTLYRATYNLSDMSLITPWYDASGSLSAWDTNNSPNRVYTYTGALTTPTGKYDLYFYGSSNPFYFTPDDRSHRLSISNGDAEASLNNPQASVNISYPLGFGSNSSYPFNIPSDYVNTYCQYFVPKTMPDVNTGIVGDHSSAEDALVNGYNPDNLTADINISVDSDAWGAIFSIFNLFISENAVLQHLIITMLSLGFIALLLNR